MRNGAENQDGRIIRKVRLKIQTGKDRARMLEGECVFDKSRDMAKMIMGQIDCLVAWRGSVAGLG